MGEVRRAVTLPDRSILDLSVSRTRLACGWTVGSRDSEGLWKPFDAGVSLLWIRRRAGVDDSAICCERATVGSHH